MQITILGCGGSDGVPQIGCECNVCTSFDSYNKRTRSSIYIEKNGFRLLVDAGPDLRQQILRENISYVDAVFVTHAHYDHMSGLGDLKLLRKSNQPIQLYGDEETMNIVQQAFPYAFRSSQLYPAIFKPQICVGAFSTENFTIIPFRQSHGKYYSYGVRIDNFAYSTDVSDLDDAAYNILKGVNVWVIDCVRYYKSPTHFALDDAIAAILRVNPQRAILTHMCHDIDYKELSRVLPSNINLAYDGMKITLDSKLNY